MGVASHLGIALDEYDARIRTFVPHYEPMLATVADALRLLDVRTPAIVEMGIGTGALAERCLAVRPGARLTGVDADPAMLDAARARLAGRASIDLVTADFLTARVPPCDAIVACIALHHVRTADAKRAFYTRCGTALQPGGLLATADCFPAREPRLAARQRAAWLAHLERTCSRDEAEGYLTAWAAEDVYFPLENELLWLREAGLVTEILWRMDGFAVIAALKP